MLPSVSPRVLAVFIMLAASACDPAEAPQQPDAASPTEVVVDISSGEEDTAVAAEVPVSGDTASEVAVDVVAPLKNPIGAVETLSLGSFAVAPGTERQVCQTFNLDSDEPLDVVKIVSTMEGTSHHFNLYKVINDDRLLPAPAAESVVHDCQPADEQFSGDAAYIFGSATPERTFETPQGVAIQLEPGQRLILEQHVINFTPTEIQGGVTVELSGAADPSAIDHYADVMWFNWMGIFLPPGQETSSGTTCTVPYDVNLIGLMGHFHELGTHFQVERVQAGATMETLYEDTDWAHPKYEEYAAPVLLEAGDGLKWTCTWFNHKSSVVTFGPDSTDEMCIAFALAYPTDSKVGEPIQCNKVF